MVNFPVRQTPSGGHIFALQHREEGQMQREVGEGSKAGEMLTFSREQRCIEAAVAAASLPPSLPPLSASPFPSLPLSLHLPFLLCAGWRGWNAGCWSKQPTRHQWRLSSPHALPTRSLSYPLLLSLVISLPSVSFISRLLSCCSSSQRFSLCSPHIFCKPHFSTSTRPPFIPPHPFLPLSLSSPLPASLHLNSHV